MKKAITGCKIFYDDELLTDHALLIDDECIEGVVRWQDVPSHFSVQQLDGGVIAPGFIDLQVNGGGGVLFNNINREKELDDIAKAHQFFGTTSIVPTVITDSLATLKKCMMLLDKAIQHNSALLGIHIEGYFLSKKYRGAHKEEFVTQISEQHIDLFSQLKGYPALLTLAPEYVSTQYIERLVSLGIKVLAGHSGSNYQQINRAVKYGLSGFTHLFNAMAPMNAREPGMIGSALSIDETVASIIVDLHHVHPALVHLAYRQKPKGKLFFISDAMATINSGNSFTLYEETLYEKDGRIINAEGKLAGSSITMIDAVKNAYQKCNIPLKDALRMASEYPAKYIGVDDYLGSIKPSYRADLVHFDEQFKVQNVWSSGAQVKIS